MAVCLDVGGGLAPSAEDYALLVSLDDDNLFTAKWLLQLLKEARPRPVSREITGAHYHNLHGQGTYSGLVGMKSLLMRINEYDLEFLPMGCQGTDLNMPLASGGQFVAFKEVGGGPQHPQRPEDRREERGPECRPQGGYTSLYCVHTSSNSMRMRSNRKLGCARTSHPPPRRRPATNPRA